MRLYGSVILSTLLYSALTTASLKRLDGGKGAYQLSVAWKEKITN